MTIGVLDVLYLFFLIVFAFRAATSPVVMGLAFSFIALIAIFTDFVSSLITWVPLTGSPTGTIIVFIFFLFIFSVSKNQGMVRLILKSRLFLAGSVLFFVACMLGESRDVSFGFFLRYYVSVWCLYFLAVYFFDNPATGYIFKRSLIIFIIVSAVFSFWQGMAGDFGVGQSLRDPGMISEGLQSDILRAPSFWGSSYSMAEFALLCMPLVFPALFKDGKSVLPWILIVMMFLALLLTQVRSGIVIFITQIGMYALMSSKRLSILIVLKKISIGLLLSLIIVFLVVQFGGESGIFSRLTSTFTSDAISDVNDSMSTISRLIRAGIAWEIFLDSPVIGQGVGRMPVIYPEYGWFFEGYGGGAHNMYLQVLAEMGLVGFCGLILNIAALVRCSILRFKLLKIQYLRTSPIALILVTTLILDGLFSEVFCYQSRFIVTLLIGFAMSGETLFSSIKGDEVAGARS